MPKSKVRKEAKEENFVVCLAKGEEELGFEEKKVCLCVSVGVFFFVLRLLKTEERRSRRIIARGDETNHRQAASLDSSTAATDKITAAEERFTLSSTSPFSPIDDTFKKYFQSLLHKMS